jgi:glycerol kinase
VSSHSIEAFTPSTGSALNWLCSGIGLFDSPTAISDLASTVDDARGTTFIPSLAGLRNPVASPTARGSFVGLSLGTTKAQLARSVLEGIAHSTADSTEAARQGSDISSIRTGGGISASNPLVQLQADLIGVPVLRLHGSAFASLRGAALLGGSRGLFWDSLTDAIRTLRVTAEFSPQISADEREYRRESWRQNLELELDRAPANRSPKNRNR